MELYNVVELSNVIFELATTGHDGTYTINNSDEYAFAVDYPLTAEGIFLENFMAADPYELHQGEQGGDLWTGDVKIGGHPHFLQSEYKGVPEWFTFALSAATSIRIEDAFGNWKSYQKTEGVFWAPIQEHYENEVKVQGAHFTPYTGIRDDALKALTDGKQTVLSAQFHRAFDQALKLAEEKYQSTQK